MKVSLLKLEVFIKKKKSIEFLNQSTQISYYFLFIYMYNTMPFKLVKRIIIYDPNQVMQISSLILKINITNIINKSIPTPIFE